MIRQFKHLLVNLENIGFWVEGYGGLPVHFVFVKQRFPEALVIDSYRCCIRGFKNDFTSINLFVHDFRGLMQPVTLISDLHQLSFASSTPQQPFNNCSSMFQIHIFSRNKT